MLTENSIGLGFVGIQVIVMIWLCVAFNSISIFNYMYIVAKVRDTAFIRERRAEWIRSYRGGV